MIIKSTDSEIQEILAEAWARIDSCIACHKEKFDSVEKPQELKGFRLDNKIKKLEKQKSSLQTLFNNVPAIFKVAVLAVDPNRKKTHRLDSKRGHRRRRRMARKNAGMLVKMGLTEQMVADMALTGHIPQMDGVNIDLTIEHVVPLSFGGKNGSTNTLAVPKYVNYLFEHVLSSQRANIKTKRVLALQFADIARGVPYVPGGFRQDFKGVVCWKRTNELLGFDFYRSNDQQQNAPHNG